MAVPNYGILSAGLQVDLGTDEVTLAGLTARVRVWFLYRTVPVELTK